MYTQNFTTQTGFYNDEDGSEGYSVLGYYTAELLRSTRLVVDTGLHAFRWTREQVSSTTKLLAEYSKIS